MYSSPSWLTFLQRKSGSEHSLAARGDVSHVTMEDSCLPNLVGPQDVFDLGPRRYVGRRLSGREVGSMSPPQPGCLSGSG